MRKKKINEQIWKIKFKRFKFQKNNRYDRNTVPKMIFDIFKYFYSKTSYFRGVLWKKSIISILHECF